LDGGAVDWFEEVEEMLKRGARSVFRKCQHRR
jgi:hypothetical protein